MTMDIELDFEADERARKYCDLILSEMIKAFGIDRAEAVGRLNRAWRRLSITGDDMIYHEDEEFWAFNIYYGHDSFWWKNPPGLKALPFP